MDAYEVYFASAVAATVVLRSIFAAIFPLIAPAMFGRLGDAWGMSVFAFLGLACAPIPFLFWVSSPAFDIGTNTYFGCSRPRNMEN